MHLLVFALAALVVPTALAQPAPNGPPSGSAGMVGGPSTTRVTVAAAVTTAGLVGTGALLIAVDPEDGFLPLLTGAALISVGLALGPSTGNLIAGGYRDAAIGSGLRIAGAVALGGAASACGVGGCHNGPALILLGSTGAALIVGGVAYDLLTAPGNARRARERRAARLQTSVGFDAATGTPIVALRVGL